jgi:hypothetical protein
MGCELGADACIAGFSHGRLIFPVSARRETEFVNEPIKLVVQDRKSAALKPWSPSKHSKCKEKSAFEQLRLGFRAATIRPRGRGGTKSAGVGSRIATQQFVPTSGRRAHMKSAPHMNSDSLVPREKTRANSQLKRAKLHLNRSRSYMVAGGAALSGLAISALVNHRLAKRAERDNAPTGKFIEVGGVRLHYVERGTGDPLVLLHGNGSMVQDFQASGLMSWPRRGIA